MEHSHGPIFPPKKTRLFFFTSLVLALTGSFITLDILNYFNHMNFLGGNYLKLATSALSTVTVLVLGRNAFEGNDRLFLGIAFSLTFIHDAFLTLGHDTLWAAVSPWAGGILFIAIQVLLAIRNGRGFPYLFREDGSFRPASLLWAAVFFLPALIILILAAPALLAGGIFPVAAVKILILTAALWIGWSALRYHVFPRRNAWMIALGTTSYALMTIISTAAGILAHPWLQWAAVLSWAFYTPFLILLPYSAVNWER